MSWPCPPRRDRRRDPGPPSRSPRRPAPARLPSGLAVLLCAYAALGAAYAWRIPILEGADENGHASYIDFLTAHHAVPPIGTVWEAVQPPLYYGVAAGVVALAGAPRLMPPALRLNPGFRFDAVTSADAYDPHSYTPAEAIPARRLRLLSTLFGALTLGLIYAAAVAASGRRSLALAATALPALTPQFVHHHAVITNDALATTWCALLTWQIVRRTASATPAPAPDRRPPGAVVSAAAMGVVAGLGMWTKYTMAPVAAAAGVVLLLGRADGTAGPRRRLRRAAAFTIAALVVCGPLLAWNTLRYGDPLAHAAMRRAHRHGGGGPLGAGADRRPVVPVRGLQELLGHAGIADRAAARGCVCRLRARERAGHRRAAPGDPAPRRPPGVRRRPGGDRGADVAGLPGPQHPLQRSAGTPALPGPAGHQHPPGRRQSELVDAAAALGAGRPPPRPPWRLGASVPPAPPSLMRPPPRPC
ncbi:MAG: glycosyltransferase family 39 protein [Anaerolineae bacterium]